MADTTKTTQPIDLFAVLRKLLRQLKKYWWAVLLVFAICIGGSVYRCLRSYTPTYQAEATFGASSGIGGVTDLSGSMSYYDMQLREQILATFPAIYATEGMQERMKRLLGVDHIPGKVTVSGVGDTFYFKITATASAPETALALLEAAAECYPEAAAFVIGTAVLDPVEAPHGSDSPINSIGYGAAAVKGAFVAAVLCTLLLLLAAYRQRTVESAQDMKEVTKHRCLGTIPNMQLKKRRRNMSAQLSLLNPRVNSGLEPGIGAIRTQLLRHIKQTPERAAVVMVTSTCAGEGKTTVAMNLAISIARTGKRVILVDADLRSQSVTERFGVECENGLLELLQGSCGSVQEALTPIDGLQLQLLAGESCTDAPLRLLESQRAAQVMEQLRQMAELVILDSPPAGLLADAASIGVLADCAVYVVRCSGPSRHQIADCMRELEKGRLSIAGYVLNGGSATASESYGYGRYGSYGKYGRYGKYGKYGKTK